MSTESTKKNEKNDTNYFCIFCDFNTCKKTDYDRHALTMKHKINTLATKKRQKTIRCENCEKCYNKQGFIKKSLYFL